MMHFPDGKCQQRFLRLGLGTHSRLMSNFPLHLERRWSGCKLAETGSVVVQRAAVKLFRRRFRPLSTRQHHVSKSLRLML